MLGSRSMSAKLTLTLSPPRLRPAIALAVEVDRR